MKMSGILETPPSEDTDWGQSRAYSVLDFSRRDVRPIADTSTRPSGLTRLLDSPSAPIMNPFSHLVRSSRLRSPLEDDPEPMIAITVYFPHAEAPYGASLVLELHEEARVDELVGLALWSYWEKGWFPQLSINHTESHKATQMFLSSWNVFPVNDGFVNYEHGAHDPSDKVRLLNGVVDFALLRASEDDNRKFKLGHRKSYSLPSNRMSLLLHARKKSQGSKNSSTKSVFVRKESSSSSDELEFEIPIFTEMQDIVRRACKLFDLSHSEDYVLMALDVKKALRTISPSHRLSSFPDAVEFTLAKLGSSPSSPAIRHSSLPNSYTYVKRP
ncbi:Component of a membrane-bound complex containing the Tor2p kinase [Marasmius crinis-equi]|uniref:Component of a membrane-bound complex containing the Tor2p kinase n=1 Tax=Marasmius crinis-equi TaxID=585013 RepID=A0ABR3FFW3_9AGAR